ncbi:MAG: helix-turn-helix domain-containing protein [Clostridiales bacterium]|nr:helix-turn-helix domain-containing protein [Clostridiales bacterium]
MSFRLFQELIEQIKDIVGYEFGIIDNSGVVVASSDESKEGQPLENIYDELTAQSNVYFMEIDGILYEKVYIKRKLEFITYIKSVTQDARKILSLISMNVKNSKVYYDEKYDKINFMRSIITDNILLGDISVRAKDLHIKSEVLRQVFLINTGKSKDMQVHDVLCGLFPDDKKDFVIVSDEERIVVIREVGVEEDDEGYANKLGKSIADTISAEAMEKVRVGISTVVSDLRDIHRAYKEAEMAITIGRVFQNDKQVINYNRLGIGRLIYQLPTTLCRLFLKEVFRNDSFETLDTETVVTIQKFFENSLNVSETARQLFIHRNTLVYRLDKIQKATGLDLRMFDDAIIFKVAMLVKNYLDHSEFLGY